MNKRNLADLVIRHSEFKGEMGVARADITPPAGIYARSWGSAKHDAATGIHRPLVATCLFFRGGDPQLELYLLCFDLGWWYDNAHEREIRARILAGSGIRDDQLVTHMGHTHSGPASNLQNLERELAPVNEALTDSILLAGSEAYQAALLYYNNVKVAKKVNVPSATSVYDDLSARCPGAVAKKV